MLSREGLKCQTRSCKIQCMPPANERTPSTGASPTSVQFHNCSTYSELKASPHDVNSHTPMALRRFSWVQSKCGQLQTMEPTVRPSYKAPSVTTQDRAQSVGGAWSPTEKQKAVRSQGGRCSQPFKHLHLLVTVQSQHRLYTVSMAAAKFTYPKLTPLLPVSLYSWCFS